MSATCVKQQIITALKALVATIRASDNSLMFVKVMQGMPLIQLLADNGKLPCAGIVTLDDQLAGQQDIEDISTDWYVGVCIALKRVKTDDDLADIETLDANLLDAEARVRTALEDASVPPAKRLRWVKTLTAGQNASIPFGTIMPVFNAGYLQPEQNAFA